MAKRPNQKTNQKNQPPPNTPNYNLSARNGPSDSRMKHTANARTDTFTS